MHSPEDDTAPGKLLRAGLDLFSQHGTHGVSIQQVCKLAGISIGSAYYHFGGKQEIANELLRAGLAANAKQREDALALVGSAEEAVTAVVCSLIDWIEQNQAWAKYIYLVADSAQDLHLEQCGTGQQDLYEYFKPWIDAGEIRNLPAQLYASILVGPTHDCARRFLSGRISPPLHQYAKDFAQIAWESLKSG
jgi:AcrR family transcriptional regulator